MNVSSEIQKTAAPRSDTGRLLLDGKDRSVDPVKYCSVRDPDAAMLHQAIGNQRVKQLFASGGLQTKLKIGGANDVYEQESDRVADQVLRTQTPAIRMKPG